MNDKFDPLCIKSDVCDMAVCDWALHCSHAVRKSELAQRSDNISRDAIALCKELSTFDKRDMPEKWYWQQIITKARSVAQQHPC